jgi:DNA-binding NtrC family response regulator
MPNTPRPSPGLPPDVETVFHLLDKIEAIQPQDEETTQQLASVYEALGDCYRGLRMFGRCLAMYERSLEVADSADRRAKLAELLVHLLGPAGSQRAQELVGQPVPGDRSTPAQTIARLISRKQAAVDRVQRLAALRTQHPALGALVGQSAHMLDVYERIVRYAPTPLPVLITGPTGSGKELVARALHACSPRARHPFIAVNCGGILDSLFESEVFGHTKGAFTGADREHPGFVGVADQGTLFLDEVSKLPLGSQAKLLRVLQTGEYYRVGDSRVRTADLRLLAASNQDLPQRVQAGAFLKDLLARLRVLEITLRPVDDRLDDLLPLARHFVANSHLVPKGTTFSNADLFDWERLRYLARQRIEAADAWSVRDFEHAVYQALVDGELQPRGDRPLEDVLQVRVHSAWRESIGPTSYTTPQLTEYDMRVALDVCRRQKDAARLLGISAGELSKRTRQRRSPRRQPPAG